MKEIVYKNLFFILYITYLSTFSKTASVLPCACLEICRDKNEDLCKTYLKADYRVKCQGQSYNHLLVLAYISTAYIFALPTATFIALWRHRRAISSGADGKGVGVGREIFEGLRFLSDNYEPCIGNWLKCLGKQFLGIGAVSRIPAENISNVLDKRMDTITMKILIFGANTLVIGLLVGKQI